MEFCSDAVRVGLPREVSAQSTESLKETKHWREVHVTELSWWRSGDAAAEEPRSPLGKLGMQISLE